MDERRLAGLISPTAKQTDSWRACTCLKLLIACVLSTRSCWCPLARTQSNRLHSLVSVPVILEMGDISVVLVVSEGARWRQVEIHIFNHVDNLSAVHHHRLARQLNRDDFFKRRIPWIANLCRTFLRISLCSEPRFIRIRLFLCTAAEVLCPLRAAMSVLFPVVVDEDGCT